LIFAIEMNSNLSEIARLIEEQGGVNDVAVDGRPAIVVATEMKRADVVRLLIKNGASVAARTPKGAQALHVAASVDVEMCQVLIDAGADVNSRELTLGYTPLHFAAHFGNAELVEFLLGKGADPCAKSTLGFSAVRVAREFTESEDKQRMLEKLRKYAEAKNCW
jgi:ankyrin repeat protein